MAQTLHLDLAAAEVQTLHSRGKEGTGEYEVAMEKAKVVRITARVPNALQ